MARQQQLGRYCSGATARTVGAHLDSGACPRVAERSTWRFPGAHFPITLSVGRLEPEGERRMLLALTLP